MDINYSDYFWDIIRDNYKTLDKHVKKILEEVKLDPSKRNKVAGIIDFLKLDDLNNPIIMNLEIPADALLRIYQFNYEKIQESLNKI